MWELKAVSCMFPGTPKQVRDGVLQPSTHTDAVEPPDDESRPVVNFQQTQILHTLAYPCTGVRLFLE